MGTPGREGGTGGGSNTGGNTGGDTGGDADGTGEPAPLVLGLGGTIRSGSSGQRALRYCLNRVEKGGARTCLLGGTDLEMAMYAPERAERDPRALALVDAASRADALVIASPGYHGGISGMVKNALDYLEDLRDADPPYLDGRAVGCLVTSDGRQSGTATLMAMRSVVHALRGWPTPLGVVVDTSMPAFDETDVPAVASTRSQLDTLADQVGEAARIRRSRTC